MLVVMTIMATGFGALRLPVSLLWRDGGRIFIADSRHAGPYGGCACGNAGRFANQSSGRTVVFMAYFSSARTAWLNISSLKGFTIASRAER